VITKIHSRKKNTVTYTFRQSYLLAGMVITIFETQFYPHGIQVKKFGFLFNKKISFGLLES
jgi:IQ motif/SEC7 domain-containing protein